MNKNIVIIDGCRTPFLKSGGSYIDLMSYQLGKFAIKGLLLKTGIDPDQVDSVIMGTVISNVQTSNVARESAITAGLSQSTACHTVAQACISANRAVANGIMELLSGQASVVIAGGVDNTSDSPIGYKKSMRKKLFKAQKLKGFGDTLKFVFSLRPSDFLPDRPKVAEYITNRTMGEDCEILVSNFQVSREEQDEFALRSHNNAAEAVEKGIIDEEICAVSLPPKFKDIVKDNGIRPGANTDKLSGLRPAFDKKYGTLTAGNSSFLTDGAAAVLLTTKEKAKELGLTPKARVVDFTFTGQSLEDELLMGPAYATAKLLKKTGYQLSDFDVFEFHEAFAGQVLANLKALNSDKFSREKLGWDGAVGAVPMDKLNLWGGSLSIGHPFGATGARLVTTAANRLIKENGKLALIASCAAGAQGHAMILERV